MVFFCFLLVDRLRSEVEVDCCALASGEGEARRKTEGDGMVIASAIADQSGEGRMNLQNRVMFGEDAQHVDA